jgi:hypothetical protein
VVGIRRIVVILNLCPRLLIVGRVPDRLVQHQPTLMNDTAHVGCRCVGATCAQGVKPRVAAAIAESIHQPN